MLCSECNKNPAILFYKKIENGKESLEGYCYDCAKAKGINPNEVLYKQNEILSKDNVNLNDMTKQFETIFKDLAENINLEDIENIDGAITFENAGDENGDDAGKISGAAIPLSSLFSNMFGNSNNNNGNNEQELNNGRKKVKVEKKKNKGTSFMKNVLFLTCSEIIVKILGLVYRLVITNVEGFGDTGLGYYSSGYQIYSLLLTLSSIGIPPYLLLKKLMILFINLLKNFSSLYSISAVLS